MTQHSSRRMVMNKAVKYGAIAGSIATWTISTAVAGSELELGLPITTLAEILRIQQNCIFLIDCFYHSKVGAVI